MEKATFRRYLKTLRTYRTTAEIRNNLFQLPLYQDSGHFKLRLLIIIISGRSVVFYSETQHSTQKHSRSVIT